MNILNCRHAVLMLSALGVSSVWGGAPLSCMVLEKQTGGWVSGITLKNNCGEPVDLQHSLVEFDSNLALDGSFWGSFGSVAYPSNPTISSEKNQSNYHSKLFLNFPEGNQWWKPNTVLAENEQITVKFSSAPEQTISHATFYPMVTPVIKKGKIRLQYPASPTGQFAKPSNVTISDGASYTKTITDASWGQAYEVTVPYGNYQFNIMPLSTSWTGSALPTSITINGQSTSATTAINYQQVAQYGSAVIHLNGSQPQDATNQPQLHITNMTTGEQLPAKLLTFGQSTTISQLAIGNNYQFQVGTLYGQQSNYSAQISPSDTIAINSQAPVSLQVDFITQPINTIDLSSQLSRLPNSQAVTLTATDNYGNQYQKTLSSNQSFQWALPTNRQYNFSAPVVTADAKNYEAKFTPQSLVLTNSNSQNLAITFSPQTHTTLFSPYVDVTLGAVTKWDSATGSMQPIGLLDIVKQAKIKSLHLAFITARNGCNGSWNGYPVSTESNGFAVPVFKQLKQQGVRLTVALGGLNGTYLAQACENTDTLFAAYEKIIQAYQPDELDFDVENTLQTNNQQLATLMQTIKRVQAKYPDIAISFTLPVLPSGLVPGVGENVIAQAKINGLDDYLVNIMAMDYGTSFQAKTMGDYAIDALTNTLAQLKKYYPTQSDSQLWPRLGVTPMIGLNDTIPLNFSLDDVDTVKAFAKQKKLGLMSLWSITRDHPCDNSYVSITCTSKNPQTGAPNQSVDYQYSSRFQQ